MRRQRNNIATKVPLEQRRIINRLLVDGYTYKQIGAELARQFPTCPTLHSSTLAAWQRSAEFTRYRTARETDRDEIEQTRAMAEALNDGAGPASTADLVVMEVVRELHRQIKGGQITDLDNLGAVTKALAPLMRAQAAQDLADSRARESALKGDIEALKDEHARERATLQGELAELKEQLAAATNKETGTGDLARAMSALDEAMKPKA